MSELKRRLESVLFASGKKLTLEELSKLVRERDVERIKQALIELKADLEQKGSSIMLIEEGTAWKLQVKEGYLPFVSKIVTQTELSKTILETLAVVAFKAPVLQSNVIKIRTNKAYKHLDQLEELGYISREKKGRTKLIKLTQKFFEYFDIPPQALKDKFKGYKELEKVIEKKEEKIEEAQEKSMPPEKVKTEEGELETFGVVEKYDEKITPPLEEAKTTVGELEVYGEPEHTHGEPKKKKKPKKKHHKKKKPELEETVAPEPAEEPVEVPEEPPEEPEEKPEPVEVTGEKPAEELSKEEVPAQEPEETQEEESAEPKKAVIEEKPGEKEEPKEELAEEKTPELPERRITEESIKEAAEKAQPKESKEGKHLEVPKTMEEQIEQKAEDIVYPHGKPEEIQPIQKEPEPAPKKKTKKKKTEEAEPEEQ